MGCRQQDQPLTVRPDAFAIVPPDAVAAVAELLTNYENAESGCWLWLGYVDANGYGRVGVPGARKKNGERSTSHQWVHRVSYEMHTAVIPERYEVDHTCQVTQCMNPAHLEIVTRAEHIARTLERLGVFNRQQMAARMRVLGATYKDIADALGYAHRASAANAVTAAIAHGLVDADEIARANRLGPVEREEIRDLYAMGIPQTVLAEIYGVDNSHVSRICSGQSSGHTTRKGAA